MDFLIARENLHRCRFADAPEPHPEDGQALLNVQSFGLTSNNITYAVFGERMSYWNFFPAEDGWGRMPVWGFAEVAESRHESLASGARVYGYLPPSTHLLLTPERVDARGFRDGAAHRASLPAAYNGYVAVEHDPVYEADTEDQQMLLRPLFFTSYLIDDFLADSGLIGETAIVLSSASSKTASALAFLLSRRQGARVIGLSSARSVPFASGLGVYEQVLSYESLEELGEGPAVYVDMAGNAALRDRVHAHYGERLSHSAVVGATHHEHMGRSARGLPGPAPTFFFAPDRVLKRTKDWGREGFEQRLAEAWRPYVRWTDRWLEMIHARGAQALERAYLDLLDGRIDPAKAHVLTLQP